MSERPAGAPPPALSVVIPSVNGWADLAGCLKALERQETPAAMELLVPERCGPAVRETIARHHPGVRVLPVAPGTSIPAMRALAFAAARAPTVAVLEDHVRVPPDWAGKVLEARAAGVRVIGGTVTNAATERLVDRAAFLCEYSQLAAPLEPGPATWLTGNNTAYDRSLLVELRELLAEGRWEDALHDALRARGVTLWCRPDLTAEHKKHYTVGGYLSQRFLFARAYAALRLRNTGWLRRLGRGLLAAGLPPVLLGRIVARVWRGKAHRRELVPSLPLLLLFVAGWGAGELVGAWFGEGNALARVT
jgi:hypothetical protein